jgi:dipeptidyl aminopeptidase/acylaminoacyl peptidase
MMSGTKRWREQRWLIDNVIQANGMDWDQTRSVYIALPGGPESASDMVGIRARIKKFVDAAPAFEAAARRREARAIEFEHDGETVSARENYFIAATQWGGAQWPIDETNEQNVRYNTRKRECYRAYARLADHRVEEVWVPLGAQKLPAWLHLPYGYSGGRISAVVSVPGMDSYKEIAVAMYGDRWLNRGVAVLALEGPGQYESAVTGVYFTVEAWRKAGTAAYEFLAARPEIDAGKIGFTGNSFGSFFSTIAASAEPRLAAVAVTATNLEPGAHTIFQEASPTFKTRFMWMSNFTDEEKFDEFRKTITWEGSAEKINVPYLAMAGGSDELCPLHFTELMFSRMRGPRQLVVYQDCRHALGGVPSVTLGPHPAAYVANWMAARLNGKPMTSERWDVDAAGRIAKAPL